MFQVKRLEHIAGMPVHHAKLGRPKRTIEQAERELAKHPLAIVVNTATGLIERYGKAGPARCLGIGNCSA